MKRDMICLSEILHKIEKSKYAGENPLDNFRLKGHSKRKVDYHIQLLKDADFIKTTVDANGRELPVRLTWKGHEYMVQSVDSAVKTLQQGIGIVEDIL